MIYRKRYMDRILPFVDTPFVKILTGIRRCGKSTILLMLKEELERRGVKPEQILFYRFDSMEHEALNTAGAMFEELRAKLYPAGKTYLFLDEVQEVRSWEKAVNSLLADYDVDLYVTGSNSRMMSGELATYLTGRYVSFRVFPLSFSEYLEFRRSYTEPEKPKEELLRYLRYGGFPALHLREYSAEEAYTVVRDIYSSVIFTDIVRRNQIRKVDQLERVVKYAFDNVGQTFSALTLSKYIKSQGRTMDPETVYSYLEKLEKAYLLHRCTRYDIKGKEHLKTQEKFYLADPAFRHAILGYDPNAVAVMMENVIYLELLARGFEVNVGKLDGSEVDFVASKQDKKLYVQVCYEINSTATEKREYDRLLDIRDNYPKFVVRMDDFAAGNHEGIQTVHLADFLLSEAY